MTRPLRVFLCHASQDKPAVRELYNALNSEDWIDPWLDEEKLSLGQHWTTVIEDALEDADIIIIFLSGNSVRKEGFVQRELNYAWELSLEKPRETIFLIPFRLDDCNIPRHLKSRQWGDYFGDKKENTYQVLLRSLKQRHLQKLQIDAAEKAEYEKIEYEKEKRGFVANVEHDELQELKPVSTVEETKKAKPFTKVLDPSSLAPSGKLNLQSKKYKEKLLSETVSKSNSKNPPTFRTVFTISLISIFLFIGISYRLKFDYIGRISSIVTMTNTFSVNLPTPTLLTSTNVPLTSTLELTPSPIPTSTLGIGSTLISEKDGMVLVYVPAGEFTMGSENGESDEKPEHQVTLDAFWIDRTEVTNAIYAKCVNANQCDRPDNTAIFNNGGYANHPVIYVSWEDANKYCSWAGRRLPTEAEWEKAARGTNGDTYPWGNETPDSGLLNYNNEISDTTEVGNYPNGASIYGALDMSGNVWELVNDWYDEKYYESSSSSNPLGPDSGQYRVWRGGSWLGYNNFVRSADRNKYDPTYTFVNVGFRCSRSP